MPVKKSDLVICTKDNGIWKIRIPLARLIEIQKSKSRSVDHGTFSSLKTKNGEECKAETKAFAKKY